MTAYDMQVHQENTHYRAARRNASARRRRCTSWLLGATPAVGAALMLHAGPAQAQQTLPQWQPQTPLYIQCPAPNQPLLRIPEFVSQKVAGKDYGILRGTLVLQGAINRMYLGAQDKSQCVPQAIRQFVGVNAVLPGYPGTIPFGYPDYKPPPSYPGYAPLPPSTSQDPVPGPTLRARVGDIVELTFLNQLGGEISWNTLDRGEKGQGKQGCDQSFTQSNGQTVEVYPGLDNFPDCFHGSTTGNIHFHGTHTNPQTTGDNVFIEVRPSLRENGQPLVTEAVVKPQFGEFFANCERELDKSVLSQWPTRWSDMPGIWQAMQEYLLKRYDFDPTIVNKLWPVNAAQIKEGAWPQFYIGGTPYCFRLPAYIETTWPPKGLAHPVAHSLMMDRPAAPLQMGQAPGTHWYHAHKHGSTALNVENGMTGMFIIEGGYDDALNKFYGDGWTRTQPLLLINQLGVSTNLFGAGGGTPRAFSVNGRIQPMLTMQPGEVQLWRIADTSARGGVYLMGFGPAGSNGPTPTQVFTWHQTAQDGVQFNGSNYWDPANPRTTNPKLMISPGNRADLLVKAPDTEGQYALFVKEVRSRCETLPADQRPTVPTTANVPSPPNVKPPYPTPICGARPIIPLLIVNVIGTAAKDNQKEFIPPDQMQAAFPPFLTDIADGDVKGTKTVVFDSMPTGGQSPSTMHMIDGHQFDGNVGEVVLLNTVEEWKVVNMTVNGGIATYQGNPYVTTATTDPPGVVDHPFHIHINPFQIVEFFDPNEVVPGTSTYKYVFGQSNQPPPPYNKDTQCLLYIDKPDTWKPCTAGPKTNLIWWDVFAIPSARAVFINNNTEAKTVPGYFKMRSRFVDYTGQYVIHCHILAHEDRGMMTVVEVVPFTTPYSHQ